MRARLRSWFGALLGRTRFEQELSDEMAFHLEARTAHWERQGLPRAEAARRARLEFGGVSTVQEECRQARGLRWIDELGADLVYAWRRMRAAPAFTAVAVAILAMTMGANVAVFSVLDAVLLRMLPVERPHELRELAWIQPKDSMMEMSYNGSMRPYPGGGRIATSFSYPVYTSLRDRSTGFAELFLFEDQTLDVGDGGRQTPRPALLVSGTFMRGLSVRPAIGRGIEPDDDRPGAPPVAVISYGLWQRQYGGAAAAVGRTLTVNGLAATIVGVTPPAFYGVEPGASIDLLVPIGAVRPVLEEGRDVLGDPAYWGFRMMGRVKAPATDDVIQAETQSLLIQALPPQAATDPATLPRLVINEGGRGLDSLRHNYTRPLLLLSGILGVVLLVACANIAGLLLTQTASRVRELGVRLSLGASRGRVMRQLLVESVLLAVLGGAAGTLLALVLRQSLLPMLNQDDAPIELALGIRPALPLAAAMLTVAAGVLCGLLPAVRATRAGASLVGLRTLPGAPGPSRLLAGKALIVLQVALSLVLVVGAGLFTRTLVNLRQEPLGFRPEGLVLFRVDATASAYRDTRLLDFYDAVLQRVRALPGVEVASFSRYALLAGGATRDGIVVSGDAGDREIGVHIHYVGPDYARTMGLPLVAGRSVGEPDREDAPPVAMVNETLARRISDSGLAVGRLVRYDDPPVAVEIVGVVGDARFASLREPVPPTIYLPYRQHRQHRITFAVRTAGDPATLAEPIRRAVDAIDPRVPVTGLRTQETQIDNALRQERLFAWVASGFALLALLLACLGIYGTLGYSVARRTSEIGLRLAIGASRADVVSMVLRESLTPVAIGLAAGLGAALMATTVIQSMLYGLTARDGTTIALAALGLICTAVIAAWLPSRRASRIDPMAALRCE
jgi:predicted permease